MDRVMNNGKAYALKLRHIRIPFTPEILMAMTNFQKESVSYFVQEGKITIILLSMSFAACNHEMHMPNVCCAFYLCTYVQSYLGLNDQSRERVADMNANYSHRHHLST
mmetsp:Transcript_10744/g.23326  ORF Transcript_10744/g.23326 Transcript_10744/m.23326 type:complete len:108 (-) Transcript_10744:77-400(-)